MLGDFRPLCDMSHLSTLPADPPKGGFTHRRALLKAWAAKPEHWAHSMFMDRTTLGDLILELPPFYDYLPQHQQTFLLLHE